MAYWSDVRYLAESEPGMVDVNAEEFRRVNRLIQAVLPELGQVRSATEWVGEGREVYDRKLGESLTLLEHLASAFQKAGDALDDYGRELRRAKECLDEGERKQDSLRHLLKPFLSGHTSAFDEAEPLRQWEDITHTTGLRDALSDPMVINNSVRAEGDRLATEIKSAFDESRRIEESARERCVPVLRQAHEMIPDFRADSGRAEAIIRGTPGLRQEMDEARRDPNVRLPGTGEAPEATRPTATGPVSSTLQEMRDAAARLPGGNLTWDATDVARWQVGVGETENEFRQRWIRDNREVIRAAAERYGLPADVVAGIAFREVGGKPMWLDDVTDEIRQNLPDQVRPWSLAGEPDQTSYGPMAIQVRRAAETLGYDPAHLSEEQRREVIASLVDPKQSVFVAAKHLAELKQASDFALVEPDQMTQEQRRELAARYNGGPYWQGGDAQRYANDFQRDLPQARDALR
ncbi:hypothetical protein LX15_005019 [Streptoalloteichus tenebrarius]|uniref:WXG100 family type VII secretion target n=1 Tax=Streptoalloteichus tenebrarius (strain ATCC 17920 / DSM 40477 / JCM 4838 / CBS 697.72 / NBRC 16177 / NCIMB 11028 / NRRL B-12390 / A12253. 1 / ISP 5477) TaxID=1933 RepID=A0ABT1I0I4_STRSD|nr:hypothetical protein [Streptoalloteichus tenebrarius]MCP2261298.1 hypothetical protein [Streptoalloteichus tenebrarius]BFF03696.1 hypothetical protein GCM10020241_53710 [Streptoalloteichus tenebrarius]